MQVRLAPLPHPLSTDHDPQGLSGIAFARFYLDIHPASSLTVLEDDVCVGGVWGACKANSKSTYSQNDVHSDYTLARLYNGFWAQSGLRMAGFSDQAIELPPDIKIVHDIFEAKYVTKYLEQYVENHVYNGKSLRERISFGFRVVRIEKSGGIWELHGSDAQKITARTVVVASGNTSRPAMPALPGKENFSGPIIHQKDFGRASSEVFAASSVQKITVLGGGKSAADMVYASVKAGKKVAWIIRQDGEGPAAFAAAAGKGPYRNGLEITATRMMSSLSPSSFAKPNWLSSLVHGSALGRRILTQIWLGADEACRKEADFEKREGALPGFEKLKSDTA